MFAQLAKSPPLPQHRSEEAAEGEENRHLEIVDYETFQDVGTGELAGILFIRRAESERYGGVNRDVKEHDHGQHGIQVLALGERWTTPPFSNLVEAGESYRRGRYLGRP